MQSPSPRLVTDHSKVGKKAGDKKEMDFDQYDFVIIGGGTSYIFAFPSEAQRE
jgi:hypothetical protein